MRYAQIKGGNKLHLVFEAEGGVSQPICGKRCTGYRMTINAPLGHACHNCRRVYAANGGTKARRRFFAGMKEEP